MLGQWIGRFEATYSKGDITIEIDKLKEGGGGRVYLFSDDPQQGAMVGYFEAPNPRSPVQCKVELNPVDPATMTVVPWQDIPRVFPGQQFAKVAKASFRWARNSMTVTWTADNGNGGKATLTKRDATRQSELPAKNLEWADFKAHVAAQAEHHRRYVFRGQREPWRLRTTFHRSGRSDLIRYTSVDMTLLHQRLSARTRHYFNRKNSDENGAFMHLAQHHGFPTPLLDWSYSPFVACFFAYQKITNKEAEKSKRRSVRVLQFDREQWMKDFPQLPWVAPTRPHFSLLEFVAIENERLIPQQALSGLTNVDDVESYIQSCESLTGRSYLTAIDLPVAERESVMKELALMGITAGSLFPGLDGTCEELRERLFPS